MQGETTRYEVGKSYKRRWTFRCMSRSRDGILEMGLVNDYPTLKLDGKRFIDIGNPGDDPGGYQYDIWRS